MNQQHGGGRKYLGVRRISITITPETEAKAREIGKGEVSRGIRKAVNGYPLPILNQEDAMTRFYVYVKSTARTLVGGVRETRSAPFDNQTDAENWADTCREHNPDADIQIRELQGK